VKGTVELRDPEGAARFLTEDIDFVGTGNNEFARGIDEMREYLHQDTCTRHCINSYVRRRRT